VTTQNHAAITSYQTHPAAAQAAPDWEHFFPLFYALGAQRDGEQPALFNRELMSGISMTSVAFGLPA
jgi:aromatic ring-opening dioxygenase catalytic subunit (LigB family)